MSRRALLLVNRHSRHGQQAVSDAIEQLKHLGLELMEESTDEPMHLPDVIRRYRQQVDMVIVGGGDGTLNAAVDGIVDTQLPLGVLPLGTANDLARTLGIPTTLADACQVIAAGRVKQIDLGWVNGKHFFNVASLGLSVQITQKLTKEAKHRWGIFAYAATAIQVIWQTRPFSAEIQIDGKAIQVKTVQIAVGNGRYYGGGMAVTHDATIDDQRLDLYSLELRHWWQMLPLIRTMRQGRHTDLPSVRSLHGREFEVSTRKHRPINTDGEITTYTPARFRVVPRAITVLVPAEIDASNSNFT